MGQAVLAEIEVIMTWTFEDTERGYVNMWQRAAIKPGKDATNADRFARKIIASEGRYRSVEAKTGVPWFFIGALHMRESSNNFAGVLHNGEHIIGTGRKTRLVPAGRGPFSSWEEAAIDALRIKNLHLIQNWSIARMGFEGERFNGLGYVGKGVNSSYLWAGSTLEQPGKYIADHVWDPKADDTQIGVMTVLKRLCELRPDINQAINGKVAPIPAPPDVEPIPAPLPKPKDAVRKTTQGGTLAAGIAAAIKFMQDNATEIAIGVIVAAVVAVVLMQIFWPKKKE